ncbi:hypothetical protein [Ferroplasma acidiphilum]|jgi:hypothetical protein|uniref:Uncharacterized protein n=1 Tax=Ferroplasma acidiphilum TaxID=74969 RepID=A0A1V0N1M0_9ARCH|nr:hypothetical protein [Ferroplasma acidiphilum]ARD83995.1 hypothetical protein FAD_0062 [Ferroplasma acidiphilum]MCL4349389.1 hypothetical protein [Candidatus Thermoplasmatota archaeon]NOL60651.1 hypothetical protein [Ferroplasma acidiphilum]WMT52896.1 MAG: hypothetical protein RE473_07760 [Ferroplasma acidiphilum]
MSSFKDGIIAGLKSGFIYFIIASIVNVIILYIFSAEFAFAYGYTITSKNLSLLFTVLLVSQVRDLLILGLVFGVFYSILLAKYFDIIPRNTLDGKIKFMVIAYWLVFFVIITVYSLGLLGIYDLIFYFITYIVANFFLSLLFGSLLKKYNSRYLTQSE